MLRKKELKKIEQKPAWSEEDVAMLDSAIAFVEHSAFTTIGKGKNNVIAWLKSIRDKAQPQLEQGFTDDDKEQIKKISEAINNYYPYNESSDMRMWLNSIKDRIEWLKSIISRQQPRQEWSEEDKELMKLSINNLTELKDRFGEKYGKVGDCINWIKSLRPQSQWKPSDEQIKALEHFVRSVGESGYTSPYDNNTKLLYSLLSDLKKLRCK